MERRSSLQGQFFLYLANLICYVLFAGLKSSTNESFPRDNRDELLGGLLTLGFD